MSATRDLFSYYEDELFFIRQLAHEFALRHPGAAARLQLEQNAPSKDPHVERLIEAFAVLAGRVRHKLDDEFPELTDAVLSVVYPHALAPVPSFATAQFEVHPSHAKPAGVPVPAHSPLHTERTLVRGRDHDHEQYCRYRTGRPLTVWAVEVAEAEFCRPPFRAGPTPPAWAAAAVRVRLRSTVPEMPLAVQAFDTLQLHLAGEANQVGPLYDLLTNPVLGPDADRPEALARGVAFLDPDRPASVVYHPADRAIRPVGLTADADPLLPYPPTVFPGYRLLTEYFAYPAAFHYLDVGELAGVRQSVAPQRHLDVWVFLDRTHPPLEQLSGERFRTLFRLGCTPVVNLFEWESAEPIHLSHTRPEYPVVPKQGQPLGYEVYSIREVSATGPKGVREFQPFFRYRHGQDRTTATAFWYATRRPGLRPDDRGTDVFLHLVDAAFRPAEATAETVDVRLVCTNRDLPTKLRREGEFVRFDPAFAAAGLAVRCVRNPTGSLRPPNPGGRYWHLISHLNLNHLAITADGGLDALKGILKLYAQTDAADPHAANLVRQAIDGLVGVSHRRTAAWLTRTEADGAETAGMFRGVELELVLDEAKYPAGAVLFAAVLERFLAQTASVNAVTRLGVRYEQRAGLLKRWPPRAGDRPLV